jgi:hypothetical protein
VIKNAERYRIYTDLGFLVENLKNISTEDAAGAVDNFNNKTALYEKFFVQGLRSRQQNSCHESGEHP